MFQGASAEVNRTCFVACCQSVHGSNGLGRVDGDKQEMNTMSECQVKAVRALEKSMIEPLESIKGGERGKQNRVDAEREWNEEGCREEAG